MTGTRLAAAAFITWRAIEVAPVNTRWSKARSEKACPTSGPPGNTAISSSSNASANILAISSEVAGVNSDGLIIARLPAASTPASGAKVRFTGKFQGLMMPTTPLGWKRTSALAPSKPRIAGVVLRFSGFIQAFRCALACFRGPSDAPMSVMPLTASARAAEVVGQCVDDRLVVFDQGGDGAVDPIDPLFGGGGAVTDVGGLLTGAAPRPSAELLRRPQSRLQFGF